MKKISIFIVKHVSQDSFLLFDLTFIEPSGPFLYSEDLHMYIYSLQIAYTIFYESGSVNGIWSSLLLVMLAKLKGVFLRKRLQS